MTLPQSTDAEKAVLSCLLQDPRLFSHCDGTISEGHFATPSFAQIYTFAHALWLEGELIDFITLTESLAQAGELEHVGGAANVTEIFTFAPTASTIGYYLAILREKKWLRDCIESCAALSARCQHDQGEVPAIQLETQRAMMKLCAPTRRRERQSTGSLAADIVRRWKANDRETLFGVSTGLSALDAEIGGLCAGDLIVLAGATSSGKSALALNIARDFTLHRALRTLYFTLEMSAEQQTRRLIQMLATRNLRKTMSDQRDLGDDTERAFDRAAAEIATAPIDFEDERGIDMETICARARNAHTTAPLALVIVDYDELVKCTRHRGENREQEIASISRDAKTLAGELNCPVMLLSQVTTDDKTGRIKLRMSAGKLNDANTALLLTNGDDGTATIGVLKNRDGQRGGEIVLNFDGATCRFSP